MTLVRNAEGSRRVLVVAYYFPPLGLSGVQRISKFVKYLPGFGWNPTVITASPAGYFAFDESLDRDLSDPRIRVVRTSSVDPTRVFGGRRSVVLPGETLRKIVGRISQFLFVPDNKIGWKLSAQSAVSRAVEHEQFDLIFSSAPPYTAHLIGMSAKRRHGLPLLLDFRDDWVGNPRHAYATPVHRVLHGRLERQVLAAADHVVCVNEHIRRSLLARHPSGITQQDVTVIPQGYDPADFPTSRSGPRSGPFTLLYSGVFYDAQRPDPILHAVSRLLKRDPSTRTKLRLEFAGTLPRYAFGLANQLGIEDVIHYLGYIPHEQLVRHMQQADALWMIVGRRPGAEGITTGKLFEYFGTRKPILGLVPKGEARDVLSKYDAALVVDPDDVDGIASALAKLLQMWDRDALPVGQEAFVQQFDRRILTGRLANIMNGIAMAR